MCNELVTCDKDNFVFSGGGVRYVCVEPHNSRGKEGHTGPDPSI